MTVGASFIVSKLKWIAPSHNCLCAFHYLKWFGEKKYLKFFYENGINSIYLSARRKVAYVEMKSFNGIYGNWCSNGTFFIFLWNLFFFLFFIELRVPEISSIGKHTLFSTWAAMRLPNRHACSIDSIISLLNFNHEPRPVFETVCCCSYCCYSLTSTSPMESHLAAKNTRVNPLGNTHRFRWVLATKKII